LFRSYEFTDVPEGDRVHALDELSDDDLRQRIAAIQSAISILFKNGVGVEINGDFLNTLTRRLKANSGAESHIPPLGLTRGMTRDCVDPWTYIEFDTNGGVKPCCARGAIGNLLQGDLTQILNDAPIRRLRNDLLQGTPDPVSATCQLKAPIASETL